MLDSGAEDVDGGIDAVDAGEEDADAGQQPELLDSGAAPDGGEENQNDAGTNDVVDAGLDDVFDAGAQDPLDAGRGSDPDAGPGAEPPTMGVVYVTLFTHIEDNTPPGPLPSPTSRMAYDALRASLIDVATRAQALGLPFVLQPDWKILEAGLLYEEGALLEMSNGKNLFRHLHEDLGVTIDPHSHENGGYNYSDVAYLLELLGVGGSTVIGGHIWDVNLSQFQEWDRFRTAQPGQRHPTFSWRGDILMGAGTPNHVNDPLVSGVWRPRDRDHFFEHDPAGNIVSVGAWTDEAAGVTELVDLYASGAVPPSTMLTAHWNIQPGAYNLPGGPAAVEATHFAPMAALVAAGQVRVVDFQGLVDTWTSTYGEEGGIHLP